MTDLPPDPTADQLSEVVTLLSRLVEATETGTQAVEREAKGRKLSVALVALSLSVLMVVGFVLIVARLDRNEITCAERTKSRSDLRAAIAAEFELTAEFYRVPGPERAQLINTIEADLLDRYPNPDC